MIFLDEKKRQCIEMNVLIQIQFTIVSMNQLVFHLVNRWSLTSNKIFRRPIFKMKWKVEFLFYVSVNPQILFVRSIRLLKILLDLRQRLNTITLINESKKISKVFTLDRENVV